MKYVRPHLSAPGFLDSNSVYVIQSARRNAFVGFLHIYTEAGTFILSLSIYLSSASDCCESAALEYL